MKEERLLPLGTKVYCALRSQWGVVKESSIRSYPILVKFQSGIEVHYTKDGNSSKYYEVPSLSLTEYTLENGGFTPISEYWTKPKVGDWGYFWDSEKANAAIFGRLIDIETSNFVVEHSGRWHNFSHDIPEHIKKQMQQ